MILQEYHQICLFTEVFSAQQNFFSIQKWYWMALSLKQVHPSGQKNGFTTSIAEQYTKNAKINLPPSTHTTI